MGLSDPISLDQIKRSLISLAGGYLRNPVREPRVTCSVCTTPVNGYLRCHACNDHHSAYGARLADSVTPLVYAIHGAQSAYVMRGYKDPTPIDKHATILTLLYLHAIHNHRDCVVRIAGAPVTHWATVPSLGARQGEHPRHRLVARHSTSWAEVTLAARDSVADPRRLKRDHFHVHGSLPARSHVLLIDDTWVTGGHLQSAALALRANGAARISALVLARWLKKDFGNNREFVRQRLTRDYDPLICPWTGGDCP